MSLPPDSSVDAALDYAKEGIKYAGSKLKLLPAIYQATFDLPRRIVLDGFSGTTRVSRFFSRLGSQVISNDLAYWSETFATAYLLNQQDSHHYQELIEHLNHLPPVDGWFTEHYGGIATNEKAIQANGKKALWQIHNTRKLDAIRQEIANLKLDPITQAVALTALVYALDKVDSSLGHFAAYLKTWSKRSYHNLQLKLPNLLVNDQANQVMREDIFTALEQLKKHKTSIDLTYYDPPYGSNNIKMPASRIRYQAYYHIWTSLILNDQPQVFGKANRRLDSSDRYQTSPFESFKTTPTGKFESLLAIEKMIKNTPTNYLVLSYSNQGRSSYADLVDILATHGKLIRIVEVEYRSNVMQQMRWTNGWAKPSQNKNIEYIFVIQKNT